MGLRRLWGRNILKEVKEKLICFYVICFPILPELACFGDSCFQGLQPCIWLGGLELAADRLTE